jgi:hypothetical protein
MRRVALFKKQWCLRASYRWNSALRAPIADVALDQIERYAW